jgi:hypothetical protein
MIKPSVGLTPKQIAAIARNLGEAGIDFIKDDELWLTRHHSALKERVRAVMTENQDLPDQTGRKLMYAFDISDNLDAMLEHHDLVPDERGTCTRVSLNSIGLSASSTLRKHAELPMHGHRNGRGLIGRHSILGISFVEYFVIGTITCPYPTLSRSARGRSAGVGPGPNDRRRRRTGAAPTRRSATGDRCASPNLSANADGNNPRKCKCVCLDSGCARNRSIPEQAGADSTRGFQVVAAHLSTKNADCKYLRRWARHYSRLQAQLENRSGKGCRRA